VPSISLVQQNLKEWGRHAREDFDFLVVCSDESVASDRDDPAMRYVADLGIKPTTDPKEVAAFLAKRRTRPALVISTYQSCDRVAKAQAKAKKAFDLAICDEAHRLVGHVESKFATALDDRRIRARRRLFMTATPRYFTQKAKERGAKQEIELASMDDVEQFGPEFHVLSFHDAITADPPLLTDYQVVVIGVTNAEAKAWAAEAKLVRTKDGLETDARTLAAQIGLAKAIKQYDLRRMITFHRSIRRASRFADESRRDSLPGSVSKMRPASRPSGHLWARHVSGETAASKRASLLKELGELPDGHRGLISNCSCLGEGVDVPALDGVAFIDPKGSIVDIIQAVGRVIRLSPDKTVGTIVIPVFVDETEDAEHALEDSAFGPVWQVLKALRAHDRRLADELDQLRTSLGKDNGSKRRIRLPSNIVLDVSRLLIKDFEQAFYVRAVTAASERTPLTIEQILAWADEHRARTGEWPRRTDAGAVGGDVNETWLNIDAALKRGGRGLSHSSSLARLLELHRGVSNKSNRPSLTVQAILGWADAHKKRAGKWPTQTSGRVLGEDETWSGIQAALQTGSRNLRAKSSIRLLLAEYRGVPHPDRRPRLTVAQILQWADAHKASTGRWPKGKSLDPIKGTTDTWAKVAAAIRGGKRGLKKTSLAALLARRRGVRNHLQAPPLTLAQILSWADRHKRKTGTWPIASSGSIIGVKGESWVKVQAALSQGGRGMTGGDSLARLLERERGVQNRLNSPDLTVPLILKWADDYFAKKGKWPSAHCGAIEGTQETWGGINASLERGKRGTTGGSSLAKLLAKERGVRNKQDLPPLTIEQILRWAKAHHHRTGRWPNGHDGLIDGTLEKWANVEQALRKGLRHLPSGLSLTKLLADYGLVDD
jgi:hypothetical protein